MAVRFIGMAFIDQCINHFDHIIDVLCRTGFNIRPQHAENAHVVVVRLDEAFCNLVDRFASLGGSSIDLVIDVSNIARKRQPVTTPKNASEQIKNDGRSRIADVRKVVYRRTTEVLCHFIVMKWLKWNLAAPSRVMQMQCHGRPCGASGKADNNNIAAGGDDLYSAAPLADYIRGSTMSVATVKFEARESIEQVEEGSDLAPKFDDRGLITVVTTDADSGELLMQGYMNAEALGLTIGTGEAHYYSRSRQTLWHKGATSGFVQNVKELLIDDDQDCIWLRVEVTGGASCHVGYRSCFYRRVPVGGEFSDKQANGHVNLEWTDTVKVFDPEQVYGDSPNPTQL
jgi:phosphoribosyl-AMP cyclohydrolase